MRTPRGFVALLLCLAASTQAAPQSPRRAHSVLELFNQEAGVSDPAGIRKYSKDLIGLLVPPEVKESYIEPLDPLAERLARAEQMARTGEGKLVAEADVVRVFN